jgi:hypothetical protein
MDIGYGHEKQNGMNINDDVGRARKRVSRACDRCRVKKDKCDGLQPRCSPCTANNVECSYDPVSKKRGLPEGYVRGLEKLWALAIVKINGLEDAIRQIASQPQNVHHWGQETSGEVLHTRWKESGILKELEHMLSQTDVEASKSRNKRKRADESGSYTPTDEPGLLLYSLQPEFQLGMISGQELVRSEGLGGNLSARDSSRVSLPATASAILEHYFSYTHCWLPIVEKHQVMRTCYEHAKGQNRASSADLSVLWAILAYAAQQLDHESHERKPKAMLATAQHFLPDQDGPFELGHVQAMLLIALLHIGQSQWEKAWMLIGIASRAGLRLRSSAVSLTKRLGATLQACCMLDTLVAGHLMLRPHLRRSDVGELEYLEEDASEDWEPWRATDANTSSNLQPAFTNSSYNRLIDTILIINDLMTHELQDEEIQRSFLDNRRAALDELEAKYPAIESSDAMMPHQLLLKAMHLNAAMAIAKRKFEANASAEAWAHSANETLLLFGRQQQKHALAFRNVIPILAVALRAASYGAICTKPELDKSPALTSYAKFASNMTGLVVQLSSTWAVFSSLASLLHTETLTNGDPLRSNHQNDALPDPVESQSRHIWRGQTNISSDSTNDPNGWKPSETNLPNVIDPQLSWHDQIRPSVATLQTPEQNSVDMVMSGMSNVTPAGLAMPAATEASPSFYGDEVDAIFHSFVGLDTTDWTDNRQKGLAEFGFADEDAFQAFCNDPERLLTTNAIGQAPLNAATDPWPPPGLYPGYFDRPDAQMEASQILQSLAGQTQSTVEAANRGKYWT